MTYKQIKDEQPENEQLCLVDDIDSDSMPQVFMFLKEDAVWVNTFGDEYSISEDDWWMVCPVLIIPGE